MVPIVKRITVTLPDAVAAQLEDWANKQGRPPANLATFLIELGIMQARNSGEYKPSDHLTEGK